MSFYTAGMVDRNLCRSPGLDNKNAGNRSCLSWITCCEMALSVIYFNPKKGELVLVSCFWVNGGPE
jgi:hypothetical protein